VPQRSTAFYADFGLSPHTYVIHRRVKRAQEQMMLTDKPLAALAAACGLADQAQHNPTRRYLHGR
jgi:AraC family transcriptional regulator